MQKNSKSPNIDPCGTSQSILAVLAYLFFKNVCFKDEIETTLLIDSKILEKLNLVRKLRIARFMLSRFAMFFVWNICRHFVSSRHRKQKVVEGVLENSELCQMDNLIGQCKNKNS